jgi:ferrous iron transport protein A
VSAREADRGDGHSSLDRLEPGESSIILRIEGDHAVVRRLMELGLVPGTEIEVVRRAPLGDPVEVRIRQVHLSIRRAEAARIHVARR